MTETKTEMRISEAIRNIRTAMVLFVLDMNILGFDVLPDFFGWMCLLGAVDIFVGTVPSIERIRSFGRVMIWYELALVVLNYVGHLVPFIDTVMPYIGIFILCIRIYFMYIILTAAADAATQRGGTPDTLKGILRSRNRILLAEVAVHVAAAVQGAEKIGGWLYVPMILYFLFYVGCTLHLTALREEVENWEKEHLELTEEMNA